MEQEHAKLELHYHQITEFYNLAEDLISTVEHEAVENPDDQLQLVTPLVIQLEESGDILCEEFIEIAGKKNKNSARRGRVESALRKIYTAMDTYQKQVAEITGKVSTGLQNIADPIVEKIKRQVESIISIMVDFIDLALERIMNKQHIEELKQRQEKISFMLYNVERRSMSDFAS